MSTALIVLLTILVVLNAVATVALARQIGVLHLRIRSVPSLSLEDGPAPGGTLALETARMAGQAWRVSSFRAEGFTICFRRPELSTLFSASTWA